MNKTKRLDYVDIFRGLPVLLMITHQLFNVFWVGSIYTTAPYFVSAIQSPTWYPWGYIFAFVSGMSVFLLFSRRIAVSRSQAFMAIVKRYGIYILLSLPFTWFVFGITTFILWEEVLQGIGLGAIVVAGYLLFAQKWPAWLHWLIILAVAVLQQFLLGFVPYLDSLYPRVMPISEFFSFLTSVLLNLSLRGWFSVINYFPFMLAGAVYVKWYMQKKPLKKLYVYALLPLLASILLHFTFIPIDHYGRTISLVLYGIGQTALFTTVLYHLYLKRFTLVNVFYIFGRAAIFAYIAHFILFIKPIEVLGFADTQSELVAWICSLLLTGMLYVGSRWYLRARKLPQKTI